MGIDAADAAEYVTAEEHLGILLAQGKMSEEEYNGILPKVKSGTKLDVDELSWFQPMKPVNVERGCQWCNELHQEVRSSRCCRSLLKVPS